MVNARAYGATIQAVSTMSAIMRARAEINASLAKKGYRLAVALTRRCLTQQTFAQALAMEGAPLSRSLVSGWCNGHFAPTPETRIAIKRVLKFDPWNLAELDPEGVAPHVAAEAQQEPAP